MLRRKMKVMIALCLCLVMVLSIGIGANAGWNHPFGFSITAGTGGSSGTQKKTADASFAEVQYTNITFTNSGGSVWTIIRDSSSNNASASKTLTTSSSVTRDYDYLSGYGTIYSYYKLYGSLASSVGGKVTLNGVWTP